MNTSMTINATAAWLLALYVVTAENQGVAEQQLQGTTQNDILKEYLSRGTYAFPPGPSMRLIADTIAYTVEHIPKWNPINICSYHLQEARAPARSSSPPGMRRSGCRGLGTSSGRCGCSRSWRMRPTCSTTPTCLRARR